jgi:hypothetical protein
MRNKLEEPADNKKAFGFFNKLIDAAVKLKLKWLVACVSLLTSGIVLIFVCKAVALDSFFNNWLLFVAGFAITAAVILTIVAIIISLPKNR